MEVSFSDSFKKAFRKRIKASDTEILEQIHNYIFSLAKESKSYWCHILLSTRLY